MRAPLSPLLLTAFAVAGCATTAPRDNDAAAARDVAPIEVPAIQRPQHESAAWWYRAGAARAAENGAMRGRRRT